MTSAPAPHTISLFVTSNRILPDAAERWYVCTAKPHRWSDDRLDAPWLIACNSESEARSYADGVAHAYRNHHRIRYQVEG